MFRRTIAVCAFLLIASGLLPAQQYDLRTDREPVARTSAARWRFHPGDDPNWSSPALDDSSWPLLKADQPWSTQGYKGMSGYAWYRFKVDTSSIVGPAALAIPKISTSYEVFANGVRIGGCGDLRSPPVPYRCFPQVLSLPQASTQPVSVALRVWHWPGWAGYAGGGPVEAGAIGSAANVEKQYSDGVKLLHLSFVPYTILSILYLIGGVASLSLFLVRRTEREYLWFAVMVLLESFDFGAITWVWSHSLPVHVIDFSSEMVNLAEWFVGIAFFAELLHARRTLFFRLTRAALFAALLLDLLIVSSETLKLHVGLTNAIESVLLLVPSTWIIVALLQRTRERYVDAVVLLIPVSILYGSGLLSSALNAASQLGLPVPHLESFRLIRSPFPVDISELADFLFLISMLAILINRFTRTRRVEERYASEFESARHVQEVLVPVEVGSIPGFTIEAEYRPARSVGGDSYQVLPGTNGGVLIVVGDVAGKGMPAAMLVAMIIGTVRTQAMFSMDPAEMLRALNERLCGHSSGGFSTCLAAYISDGGEMTVANGGHLSPYLNGDEMELEAELPLGVQPGIVYAVSRFSLQRGDRLTFVSDGIVEATNTKRELFGFERTAAISTHAATDIIRAAQAFGQQDDITVVTAAYGV